MEWMNTETVGAERTMLVHFCARFTRDIDAAEDLAQQALLQAWRYENQLRDQAARSGWLLSIARNTCRKWLRQHRREQSRISNLSQLSETEQDVWLVDDFDIEVAFDRAVRADLLRGIMARLPSDARDLLLRKYDDERSQAELAAELGLSEGAVEARLHRARSALKQLLRNEPRDEVVVDALSPIDDASWQETRLWCPNCARRKLEGYFRPAEGLLYMRCAECSDPGTHYIGSSVGEALRDLRTYRPAVTRVLGMIHERFRLTSRDGTVHCSGCQTWLPIRFRHVPGAPDLTSIEVWCPRCERLNYETWHSLTWSLPEARQFWRAHPRMRYLHEQEIEVAGSPAIVTGFESLADGSRFQAVMMRDSLRVLSVNGRPYQANALPSEAV
jgi:RNA polymerase sigma factor (sigma-70 family)